MTEKEQSFLAIVREFYPELPYRLEFMPINQTMKIAFEFGDGQDIIYIDDKGELVINLPKDAFELEEDVRADIMARSFEENAIDTMKSFAETHNQLDKIQALDLMAQPISVLTHSFEKLIKEIDVTVDIRFNYNITPSFAVMAKIKGLLEKAKLDYSEYDLLTELSYKTSDMNIELKRLASIINHNEKLKMEFNSKRADTLADEIFTELCSEYGDFGKAYANLIDNYGWKSTNSHKSFSASSWNEDRSKLAELLKIMLNGKNKLNINGKYETICKGIVDNLSREDSEELLILVDEFRQYHQNREQSVYILENIYGVCRMILKAVAKKTPRCFLM